VKITCRNFSPKNHRSFTVAKFWFYLKNGSSWSNKTAYVCFNKLYLKYEKTCFEETVSPTQYLFLLLIFIWKLK